MISKIYINLTNGIGALPDLIDQYVNFIRIQSTHLEQGWLEKVLINLDYDFLMNLALGTHCIIYDFSSRWKDRPSRAIWQGLPWIEYALTRCWFGKEIECERRMDKHFKIVYNNMDKKTKRKLKYFRKFLLTKTLTLSSVCAKTLHDGDSQFYKEILEKWMSKD
jgi:hypothetical protein